MSELETGNTIDATSQEIFIQSAQVAINNYKTTKSEIGKAIEAILEIKENSSISETLRKIRENYNSRKSDFASTEMTLESNGAETSLEQSQTAEDTNKVDTTYRKSIIRAVTFKVKNRNKIHLEESVNESEELGIQDVNVLGETENIQVSQDFETTQTVATKISKRELANDANIGIAMMQFEPKGVKATSDKTREIVITRYAKSRENILAVIRGTGNNVLNKVSENLEVFENIEKVPEPEKDGIEK